MQYVLGSDKPREAALSGNAKVIPGVASGRGNVMRPAAPQGLVPAVPSGPPTPKRPDEIGYTSTFDKNEPISTDTTGARLGSNYVGQALPLAASPGKQMKDTSGQGAGGGDWMARNESWLIPLLTGVGTAASSNNRYALGALAEGIGGAAAAYQPTQQAILQRESTGTEIAGQKIVQSGQASVLAQQDIQINPATKAYRVFMPDGSYLDYKAWNAAGRPPTYHQFYMNSLIGSPGGLPGGNTQSSPPPDAANTIQGSGAGIHGMGALTPVSTSNTGIVPIGNSGHQTVQTYIDLANSGGITPAMINQSNTYQAVVDATARSASDSNQNSRNLALHIAKQDLTGPLGAGPLADFVSGIVGKLNDAARRIGVPEMQFGQNAIANKETFDKLVKTSAFQQASAADQNSLNALGLSLSAIANPNMPRESQADIISKILVDGQEPMDRQGYLRDMRAEAANAGMPNAYISQAADTAFRNDKPKSSYLYEQSLLKGLMITSPNNFAKMLSGEITAKQIDDQFMKTYGVPHMSRYFTGGMQ